MLNIPTEFVHVFDAQCVGDLVKAAKKQAEIDAPPKGKVFKSARDLFPSLRKVPTISEWVAGFRPSVEARTTKPKPDPARRMPSMKVLACGHGEPTVLWDPAGSGIRPPRPAQQA